MRGLQFGVLASRRLHNVRVPTDEAAAAACHDAANVVVEELSHDEGLPCRLAIVEADPGDGGEDLQPGVSAAGRRMRPLTWIVTPAASHSAIRVAGQ